jgi:hypothetical protein
MQGLVAGRQCQAVHWAGPRLFQGNDVKGTNALVSKLLTVHADLEVLGVELDFVARLEGWSGPIGFAGLHHGFLRHTQSSLHFVLRFVELHKTLLN